MFDFMINHISRQSKYHKDYQEKHDQSAYKDLFSTGTSSGQRIVQLKQM